MRWLAFILVTFIFSCSGKPNLDVIPEAPASIIEQDKFTNVMLDMQLLEATLKLKLIRKTDIRERTPGFYNQIFEKHSVSESAFLESLDFYSSQRHIITAIFDSVEVRLLRLKDETDFKGKKETP